MKVAASHIVAILANQDQVVIRFATRALERVGVDVESKDYELTQENIDAAVNAIESPSLEEHEQAAKIFGSDAEESFMREAHAANTANGVLNALRQFAA